MANNLYFLTKDQKIQLNYMMSHGVTSWLVINRESHDCIGVYGSLGAAEETVLALEKETGIHRYVIERCMAI